MWPRRRSWIDAMRAWLLLFPLAAQAALIPVDISGYRAGAVTASHTAESLAVAWMGPAGERCEAMFSLDTSQPLVGALRVGGKTVIGSARPLYWAETGKRRGGWDQFFDFPPSHPEGTRRHQAAFTPRSARVETQGQYLEVVFEGLQLGPFAGAVTYRFFPGTRLIQQSALVTTYEPDTAFFYDAGIQYAAESDRRPGNNMATSVSYYDTEGKLTTIAAQGPERVPHKVRYRAVAAETAGGAVVAFPPPHQYFFARDYTTNMGYLWSRVWRGQVGLGIRQLPDDHSPYYPWMNAPPGTLQRLSLFLQIAADKPAAALEEVLGYTRRDKFLPLPGYKTLASHWHVASTVQAMENKPGWVPPYVPVLKAMGIDAAMIADFHGDGHPRDTGAVRLKELQAYYDHCRALSGANFLVIPSEEANVHYGGHYSVIFPKPVLWILSRGAEPFASADARYGKVYRTKDAAELFELVKKENGLVYQTHPRTKGSMGYPDKIREEAFFRDASFLGAGWKQMPSNLATTRQGLRALDLLDDMRQWGLDKKLLAEVDVFQLDHTHELYAHMNAAYVSIPSLPSFDNYGMLLDKLRAGAYFNTTGEVLLPEVAARRGAGGKVTVRAKLLRTFPLDRAWLIYGTRDGVRREPHDLSGNPAELRLETQGEASWVRLEVWDAAGNGAFTNAIPIH
jgi:hypothetical protein